MKIRLLALALLSSLALSSCQSAFAGGRGANEVIALVRENSDLFTRCAEEMEALGAERIYVAMETPKAEEGKTGEEERPPKLVCYEKESGDRTEIENEVLQEALEKFGFALIFFQTASDARRSVIFSYTKENAQGLVNGFYYSYDALPVGWWGRKADLVKKSKRYLQASQTGDAWYYTLLIQDSFYYFEKKGNLVA